MATHRAVLLSSTDKPLSLEIVSTPKPSSGQVLVTVLAVPVLSYTRARLNGMAQYPLPVPFVPGVSAIARVDVVGSDATSLAAGQLVSVDPMIRARDDVSGARGTSILLGFYAGLTTEARKLAETDWRHGSWAEKLLVPLENVSVLNEDVLVKKKGISYAQLCWINALLVPYGGCLAARVEPGETVIVCFATGHFGQCAIDVALGLGVGRVVAVGRNPESLRVIQEKFGAHRVAIVALLGDAEKDGRALREATPGGAGADCFLDWSPSAAATTASMHIRASLSALKVGGRAVLTQK
jgi:threonine dehydrogenase-like Zn-dependent dehydrogenase